MIDFEKEIKISPEQFSDFFAIKIDLDGQVKLASELHPEIASFISSIKPDSRKIYILCNALGAGEYYSSNANADFFEEDQLDPPDGSSDYGYKTFYDAGIFTYHQNKDKSLSLGNIIKAIYNKKMHRVELILEIDRKKAEELGNKDLLDKLDSGEPASMSMGARVKFDVCSICGNKAKTRAEYCDHMKYSPNKILADGRKVYVLNPRPIFFDISFVLIGADKISFAMFKIASAIPRTNKNLPVKIASSKKDDNSIKLADIVKYFPALSSKYIKPSEKKEKDIEFNQLKSIAGSGDMNEIFNSLNNEGLILKPKEFQAIILIKKNNPMAEFTYNRGLILPGLDSDQNYLNTGSRTCNCSLPEMNRGFKLENILANLNSNSDRLGLVDNPTMSPAYKKYRMGVITSLLTDPLGFINRPASSDAMFNSMHLSKLGSASSATILPFLYVLSAYLNDKDKESLLSKHPILSASILSGMARLGVAHKDKLLSLL